MKREWLVSFVFLTCFLSTFPKAKERYRMPKRLVSYRRIIIERIRRHRLQRERDTLQRTVDQVNREHSEDVIVHVRRGLMQHLALPRSVEPTTANGSLAVRLMRVISAEIADQSRSVYISSRVVRSLIGGDVSELRILEEELTQDEMGRVLRALSADPRENNA